MTPQRPSASRTGRRDPYPLRIAGVALGSVLLLLIALIWAMIGDDGRVHVGTAGDTAAANVVVSQGGDDDADSEATSTGAARPQDRAPGPGPASGAGRSPAEDTPAADEPRRSVDDQRTPPFGPDPTRPQGISSAAADSPSATPPTPALDDSRPRDPVSGAPVGDPTARSEGGVADSSPAATRVTGGSGRPSGSDPALGEAFHTEGVYRLERGDLDLAVQRLARAVEISSRDPVYREDFGWALFSAGDAREGAEQIEAAIRLDPDRPQPFARLGEVRLQLGDTAAALEMYRRFLQLNDDAALEAEAERRIREIRGN